MGSSFIEVADRIARLPMISSGAFREEYFSRSDNLQQQAKLGRENMAEIIRLRDELLNLLRLLLLSTYQYENRAGELFNSFQDLFLGMLFRLRDENPSLEADLFAGLGEITTIPPEAIPEIKRLAPLCAVEVWPEPVVTTVISWSSASVENALAEDWGDQLLQESLI